MVSVLNLVRSKLRFAILKVLVQRQLFFPEDGIDQLIAFIAPEIDAKQAIEIKALRQNLSQRLPPYMVPNRFEIIEEVPRLLSGKIDRKALKARPLTSVIDRSESDQPQNQQKKFYLVF